MIKNETPLFLRALNGETVERPPVWIMRQAGRYLPDFMVLKNKYDFFTRCQTPELATEITLMPIKQIGLDASIIFSDILVIPQAMGINVEMKNNFGPYIECPIRKKSDVINLDIKNVEEKLNYVFEAIKMTKKELPKDIPLIGFAGSPWTILCYMVQGSGSKNFDIAKKFCFENPELAKMLLSKITSITIDYLKKKVEAGADAIQIFDSWGGVLSHTDYQFFSYPYIEEITNALKKITPVIIYPKGCWHSINAYSKIGASGLGIDWTCSARNARYLSNNNITLQGNLDPSRLFSPKKELIKQTTQMLDEFGKDKYIANLGHGILPNTPVDNVKVFVETVKNYSE
ncbi:uroporphyrinogen decarboxylase [Flavobacteriaceae bacterium]|nr:uroporphyrinogen decarboxylase [Flavobacteriaceae bacterium]MDC6480301.1 uroporphyrinogen decarboxylase [Flavobacteriaceae bacterium]|tara:strand:+ start:37 stop:1068 length:1032 start_codon:yes stop_codon:yes gene_type:complete